MLKNANRDKMVLTDNQSWLAEISSRSNIPRSSWYIPVIGWFNDKVKENHGCTDTGFRVVIGLTAQVAKQDKTEEYTQWIASVLKDG